MQTLRLVVVNNYGIAKPKRGTQAMRCLTGQSAWAVLEGLLPSALRLAEQRCTSRQAAETKTSCTLYCTLRFPSHSIAAAALPQPARFSGPARPIVWRSGDFFLVSVCEAPDCSSSDGKTPSAMSPEGFPCERTVYHTQQHERSAANDA